jgi:hypothetical protein
MSQIRNTALYRFQTSFKKNFYAISLRKDKLKDACPVTTPKLSVYGSMCQLTGDGRCGRHTLNISPKNQSTDTTYPLCPSLTFKRTARWIRAIHAPSDYQYMSLCISWLAGEFGRYNTNTTYPVPLFD